MKPDDIVMAIPHAGTEIPADIRRIIVHSDEILLREPDLYTDRIFQLDGTPSVTTPYSRVIADCNRAPDEIYTEGHWRAEGVVMLCLAEGQDVFAEDPSLETMHEWIDRFHRPFHTELMKKAEEAEFLFDCHSLAPTGAAAHMDAGAVRADIILGNRQYSACCAETTQFFRSFFEQRGLSVAINDPYPGRYILGTYANRLRTPGIQIELNRRLYMNEQTREPYEREISRLNGLIGELTELFCTWYTKHRPSREMVDLSE